MAIVSQNSSLSNWNPQYSNLDIDGTPEKYDTRGILGNVDDPGGARVDFSNLDIDGTPRTYNPAGQLTSLGDNSSNLNPDGTPTRYNTQGQLAALGDNVSNINPDGLPTPYDRQGVLASLGDNVSNLNPDGSPDRYNTQGQLASLGDNVSNINPDGLPIPYDRQGILASLGDNVSNINPDGLPDRYNTQGILSSLGDNVSNINPDGLPDRYNTQGQLANLSDPSNLNPDGTPTTYNTQGVLASLGDASSGLNPDGTPTFYDTQGVLASLGDNVSTLNPDGTPATYNTQGVLGSLGDNVSTLNPDGTISTYDTTGILGYLPPNASNLDFDGPIPAGADSFANVYANGFTIQAPIGITQFIDPGNASQFGWSGGSQDAPGVDFFGNQFAFGFNTWNNGSAFIDAGNSSQFGFSGNIPAGSDAFQNIHANGFTIQAPIGVTQFIDPGNSSQFGFSGNLPAGSDAFPNIYANGFTIQAPIGITQFIDPGNSSIYGFSGQLPPAVDSFQSIHAQGFTIQTPALVTQFTDPGNSSQYGFTGNVPGGTDVFLNTYANGFTIQAPIGVTQFIDPGNSSIYGWAGNRNDAPEVNNFTLPGPSGLLSAFGFTKFGPGYSQFTYGGQTSIYGFWDVLPGAPWPASNNGGYNFFVNNNANGFTIKNPVGISQFILNGQTSIYGLSDSAADNGSTGGTSTNFFTDTHAKGFTLRTPIGVTQFIADGQTSQYGFSGATPTPVDNFISLDANGFVINQPHLITNFLNINNNKFTPRIDSKIANVPLGPWVPGIATMNNQLGQGSPRFGNTGFSSDNRYSVGNGIRLADNIMSLEKYSKERLKDADTGPYVISQLYGQNLKLRATAYNPTYMLHPLILRGIQNPDKLGPQTWGIDLSGDSTGLAAAVDGGFVRGGASTALARSIIDTARIAKFLASPRGIVWVATQFGLGKSNPRVEKNPLNTLPFNDTRSHSGIASLLSIPGTAFGLHFTRHGIPFANEAASYEQVHRALRIDTPNGENTRLWKLKQELFGAGAYNSVPNSTDPLKIGGGGKKINPSENPTIAVLSGPGGPNSVYGIGSTEIRRYTNTIQALRVLQDKTEFGPKSGINDKFNPIRPDINDRYGIYNQYAAFLNNNRTSQGAGQEDKSNNLGDTTDTSGRIFTDDGGKNIGLAWQLNNATETDPNYIPGSTGLIPDIGTPHLNPAAPAGENSNQKAKYSTLPYQELQDIAKTRRNQSTNTINDFRKKLQSIDSNTFIGQADYDNVNIHKTYGFGEQGKLGRNLSDPYKSPNVPNANPDGKGSNQIERAYRLLKTDGPHALQKNQYFSGDKINAIDYISETKAKALKNKAGGGAPWNPYGDSKDFIKFYFSGIKSVDDATNTEEDDYIIFRATVKNISDSFTPSWNQIQVMGRPEGPGNYSTFERTLSFDFTAYASSREEMVPMWRKLNYLSTYTMPVYVGKSKPGGPLFRITIGDMYKKLPAYFTGLTMTVNEEATWDLGQDADNNAYSRQLPNLVDVNCQMRIIHDWRHQLGGRSYSLYDDNYDTKDAAHNWLWDTSIPS